MRELHVVGVEADGTQVICRDPESGEKYRIAADERLRAAARGDISRLGQIEIDMESSLRPREIQARIRAGASVAEVAAAAGVPADKIERFAHPVLLERSRAAELAAMAHPIREDGPAVATLGEMVTESLRALGQPQREVEWDSWKGDDGYWVVQVSWHVGRTDNHAHWRYLPGGHGGTVDALDDLADELIHPEAIAPRRKLTPVAAPELTPAPQPATPGPAGTVTLDADRLIDAQRVRNGSVPPTHDEFGTPAFDFDAPDYDSPAEAESRTTERHVPHGEAHPTDAGATRGPVVDGHAWGSAPTTAAQPEPPAQPQPQAARPTEQPANSTADSPAAAETSNSSADDHEDTQAPKTRRKSRKPAVPAWEDVLLGVRSNGSN